MTATIHAHPILSARADQAQKIANHLISSVAEMRPDTELALAGLLQAAQQIATGSKIPGVAPKTVRSLRVLAVLIETVIDDHPVH